MILLLLLLILLFAYGGLAWSPLLWIVVLVLIVGAFWGGVGGGEGRGRWYRRY